MIKSNKHGRKSERGAVLLTTLLLMTVMATLAVAIMDDIRFALKRAVSVQTSEQLEWYMRGAEDFAESWLQDNALNNAAVLAQTIIAGETIIFPLGNAEGEIGDAISIQITDGRNCYNVNSLADPKIKEQTLLEFTRLLEYMDFDNFEASTHASRIQDWVDADLVPSLDGAEDNTYTNRVPPHHGANRLMVDITELRAIEGIDEDVFQRMQPLLCATKDMKSNKINLNSLDKDAWPLLANIIGRQREDGHKAAQDAAKAVIALRPAAGYDSAEAVWALPIIAELELKGAGIKMVAVKTDLVNLHIQVNLAAQARRRSAQFGLETSQGVKLISRRSAY